MLTRSFFVFCILLLLAAPGLATVYIGEEAVTVDRADPIEENIILTGRNVHLQTPVHGDVLAGSRYYNQRAEVYGNLYLGTQTGDIMESVFGDLLVFGQLINVRADTTGDIRGAGQSLAVHGRVQGDVMFAGDEIFIGTDAVIEGDLIVACGQLDVLGDVRGKVIAGVDEFNLQGTVRDVELWADRIQITGDGRVLGDITYHRHEASDNNWEDRVEGHIDHLGLHDDAPQDDRIGFVFGLVMLLTAVVSSLLLVLIWKHGVAGAVSALESRMGASILSGLLGFAATPVVAIISMVLVITLPAGVILLLLYPVLLYLGWLIFGIWLGKLVLEGLMRQEVSMWAYAPLGVFVLGILGYVPFIGWILSLLTTIVGVGMLLIQLHAMREARVW